MDAKELKTSGFQRFFIIIIALLMLISMIAGYIAIVITNSKKDYSKSSDDELSTEIAKYEEEYEKVAAEMEEASKPYFDKLLSYKKEVKGYNETAANEGGIKVKDYEEGTGRTLSNSDLNYLAYYIGWCPDETIFDSSFDNSDNPTKLTGFLDLSGIQPIEGWFLGMEGAKLGGVREITIPADLAYKDQEICGGTYKPLKFIVMPIAREGKLKELSDKSAGVIEEINKIYEEQIERAYKNN